MAPSNVPVTFGLEAEAILGQAEICLAELGVAAPRSILYNGALSVGQMQFNRVDDCLIDRYLLSGTAAPHFPAEGVLALEGMEKLGSRGGIFAERDALVCRVAYGKGYGRYVATIPGTGFATAQLFGLAFYRSNTDPRFIRLMQGFDPDEADGATIAPYTPRGASARDLPHPTDFDRPPDPGATPTEPTYVTTTLEAAYAADVAWQTGQVGATQNEVALLKEQYARELATGVTFGSLKLRYERWVDDFGLPPLNFGPNQPVIGEHRYSQDAFDKVYVDQPGGPPHHVGAERMPRPGEPWGDMDTDSDGDGATATGTTQSDERAAAAPAVDDAEGGTAATDPDAAAELETDANRVAADPDAAAVPDAAHDTTTAGADEATGPPHDEAPPANLPRRGDRSFASVALAMAITNVAFNHYADVFIPGLATYRAEREAYDDAMVRRAMALDEYERYRRGLATAGAPAAADDNAYEKTLAHCIKTASHDKDKDNLARKIEAERTKCRHLNLAQADGGHHIPSFLNGLLPEAVRATTDLVDTMAALGTFAERALVGVDEDLKITVENGAREILAASRRGAIEKMTGFDAGRFALYLSVIAVFSDQRAAQATEESYRQHHFAGVYVGTVNSRPQLSKLVRSIEGYERACLDNNVDINYHEVVAHVMSACDHFREWNCARDLADFLNQAQTAVRSRNRGWCSRRDVHDEMLGHLYAEVATTARSYATEMTRRTTPSASAAVNAVAPRSGARSDGDDDTAPAAAPPPTSGVTTYGGRDRGRADRGRPEPDGGSGGVAHAAAWRRGARIDAPAEQREPAAVYDSVARASRRA